MSIYYDFLSKTELIHNLSSHAHLEGIQETDHLGINRSANWQGYYHIESLPNMMNQPLTINMWIGPHDLYGMQTGTIFTLAEPYHYIKLKKDRNRGYYIQTHQVEDTYIEFSHNISYDTNWQMLTVILTADQTTVFLNGVQIAQKIVNQIPNYHYPSLFIGGDYYNSNGFSGRISNIILWIGTVLTPDQIRLLYSLMSKKRLLVSYQGRRSNR